MSQVTCQLVLAQEYLGGYMNKILVCIFIAMISGCAIYSHETMMSTYLLEGGLDFYKKAQVDENTYIYEVHIWEHSPTSGDLHSYRTDSTELRVKTAKILLSERFGIGCSKSDLIDESQYQNNSHPKKWLHGTWWLLRMTCYSPKNPRLDKFN